MSINNRSALTLSSLVFICLFLGNPISAISQISPSEAKDFFSSGNYKQALNAYLELLKSDPGNPDFNYKAGICFLNLNSDKTKAVKYLETAISKTTNPEMEEVFYMGKALHISGKFEEAIKFYRQALESANERQKPEISRAIETCANALSLIQFPLDVSFENLGKTVNSEFADYLPYIPSNEAFVVFTTRRKGTNGNTIDKNGEFNSDVFISEVKNGTWAKAKPISSGINTPYNEDLAGISTDGKTLFLYIDNMESSGIGDVFISKSQGKAFQRPDILGKNVDTEKFFETAAALSPDGNLLFFVSDRDGSIGGKDIYMSKKLPTGDWGIAQNLGANINSPFNEDHPFLTEDGKTLYFSSEGHNSMGGYDIFKSQWDEESKSWSEPKNLGYPINTGGDEMNFVISRTGRDAYMAAWRPEGFGDLDIYKVTFNQIDPKYTVFKGFIQDTDSVNLKTEIQISISSKKNKNLFGSYTIPETKKGKYLFYLPPGKFEVLIEPSGFKPYTEEITVMDKTAFKPEIAKNFVVTRIGELPKTTKKSEQMGKNNGPKKK